MKRMCGVGAAALVVAGVLALGGCSDGGGEHPAERPSRAATEPSAASVEPTGQAYPDTAEGRLDRRADEKGWESGYESAHAYIDDMCHSMTFQKAHGQDPGEWLMRNQTPEEGQEEILRAGMPALCKKWWPTVREALGGGYVHTYSNGTYDVVREPEDFDTEIAPGRYRTSGDLADCYWERTAKDGTVIDNRFATSAREVTVTIAGSDGQFTSRGCGTWKPAE